MHFELKFCEMCRTPWLRAEGAKTAYCTDCASKIQMVPRSQPQPSATQRAQ